jgi:hypothetical protein
MSAYTFFLRVHSPTEAQVREVARMRRRDEEWKRALQDMAAPLSLSLPSWKDILGITA